MLLGLNGYGDYNTGNTAYRRWAGGGRRGGRNQSVCNACLAEGNTCGACKAGKNCESWECKDHGYRGLSGLGEVTDQIGDTFNTITACGFMPILAGIAIGYFAKQMRWI